MLQAIGKYTIVLPLYDEKSKGGIIIPESAKKYKQYDSSVRGEVISVGPESEFKSMLKPGDKVIWTRHEGRKIMFKGQLYFSIRDRWIMAKVDEA